MYYYIYIIYIYIYIKYIYIYIYMYIYIYIYIYRYICPYIYIDRQIDRQIDKYIVLFCQIPAILTEHAGKQIDIFTKNELYRKKFSRNLLTASLLLLNFKKKTKAKTKIVSSFSETTTHIVSKKRSDKKEFHSDLLTNK